MVVLFCIPINNIYKFQLLHNLANIWCCHLKFLKLFWWVRCWISLWFNLSFHDDLHCQMLLHLLIGYLSILCEVSVQIFCLFWKLGFFFLNYWVVGVLCISFVRYICFVDVFYQSVTCLFIFSMASFDNKSFSFPSWIYQIFSFIIILYPKKSLLISIAYFQNILLRSLLETLWLWHFHLGLWSTLNSCLCLVWDKGWV